MKWKEWFKFQYILFVRQQFSYSQENEQKELFLFYQTSPTWPRREDLSDAV